MPFMKAERGLLVVVVVGALLAVLRCIPLIALPYQIDYGEGLMLEGALRVHHSQPLYPMPFAFPVFSTYTGRSPMPPWHWYCPVEILHFRRVGPWC